MTAAPEHCSPIGKAVTLDTWRKRMRMAVPTGQGHILDVRIVAIYECTASRKHLASMVATFVRQEAG
jgi:hypothetical protein